MTLVESSLVYGGLRSTLLVVVRLLFLFLFFRFRDRPQRVLLSTTFMEYILSKRYLNSGCSTSNNYSMSLLSTVVLVYSLSLSSRCGALKRWKRRSNNNRRTTAALMRVTVDRSVSVVRLRGDTTVWFVVVVIVIVLVVSISISSGSTIGRRSSSTTERARRLPIVRAKVFVLQEG